MKSKGVYNPKLVALRGAFLPNVKCFGNEIGIQFKHCFSCRAKNLHIKTCKCLHRLWCRELTKNSAQKVYIKKLFVCNIVKDNDKAKHVYSRNGITFDGKGKWSSGNDFARNVTIFEVDNSSTSHTDNFKNDFLVLGEGDTFGIKGNFGAPKKNWY